MKQVVTILQLLCNIKCFPPSTRILRGTWNKKEERRYYVLTKLFSATISLMLLFSSTFVQLSFCLKIMTATNFYILPTTSCHHHLQCISANNLLTNFLGKHLLRLLLLYYLCRTTSHRTTKLIKIHAGNNLMPKKGKKKDEKKTLHI